MHKQSVTVAVIEGLQRQTGAVQNGPTLRTGQRVRKERLEMNSPVTIVREKIDRWECYTCQDRKSGLPAMLQHQRDNPTHHEYRKLPALQRRARD